jgi:hypothetical protein
MVAELMSSFFDDKTLCEHQNVYNTVTSSMGLSSPEMPALLNMQSRRPNEETARSITALMSPSTVTSVRCNRAAPPSSYASRAPASALLCAMTIRHPSSAP